jgi:ComF family protein
MVDDPPGDSSAVGRVWALALWTFWPATCVLCGGTGQYPDRDLCAVCEADLPVNELACRRCALPLAGGADLVCGACLRRPPRFDLAFCPWQYAYPVDHLVRGLKYRGAVAYGRVLGELMARRIQLSRSDRMPEALLPVPLAPKRFRFRGYNQAIELARWIGRRLDIPLQADVAVRTRETQEQAGLDAKGRRRNIRGAFALGAPLQFRHVAIVDDVITTGSTTNELARVLKRAGATHVEVWAAARAGKW